MYDREFYLSALTNRAKAPRIYQMAREIRLDLDDEDVPFTELVDEAAAAGTVQPKTVKSWLYGAAKYGLVVMRGAYIRRSGQPPEDTRTVSLGDWPVPDGFQL